MENQREYFEQVLKKYHEYVDLYKFFNGGSTKGVCPFDDFYWRFMYTVKYEDPATIGVGNM